MPKHIHVWIGLEIQELRFTQGRTSASDPMEIGFAIEYPDPEYKTNRTNVYVPDGNYFYLPENNTHPRKLEEKLTTILSYADDRFVNFTTHSKFCIDILGEMIENGKLKNADVTIHVMTNDNSKIYYDSSFDKDGYLVNWAAGELSR